MPELAPVTTAVFEAGVGSIAMVSGGDCRDRISGGQYFVDEKASDQILKK